jgi:hypothetical protein
MFRISTMAAFPTKPVPQVPKGKELGSLLMAVGAVPSVHSAE